MPTDVPNTAETPFHPPIGGSTRPSGATNTISRDPGSNRIPTVPLPPQSLCCCPACLGLDCLDRTRFFAGQLLTESDLNNEQSYWLAKNRLHNRYLHGWGVVCGLQIVCAECDGWVTVKTGYAIDPCGNDIIVCEDQPFDVIKAIQACCAPPKLANCSPLRYTPSPTCQDALQEWCVTIEYQEQPSRMVTPLRRTTPKGEACRCADPCQTTPATTAQPCGCNTPQHQTPTPATIGSCEPTRIAEGFKICVVPGATNQDPKGNQPEPGTMTYQLEFCASLQQVLDAAPAQAYLESVAPAEAYQAVCNYLVMVKNALVDTGLLHCDFESQIAGITVPPPSLNNPPNYSDIVEQQLKPLVVKAALDCVCSAIVPTCPPDVCDDRLILACVTVQNGKIINICHFGGRRQVITFPVLYYWLSLFGVDNIINRITDFLGGICCNLDRLSRGTFGLSSLEAASNVHSAAAAATSGPGAVIQMMRQALSQKLGASLVNAINPAAQAVDLRSLIGQNFETVKKQYNLQNATIKDVSSDPSWADEVIGTSAGFAPAAFSLTQPLTVFTKGKTIVGFQPTDPIHALQQQIAQLQTRLDSMTGPPKDTGTDKPSVGQKKPSKSPKRKPRP
jgi:hypothetical protein